MIVMYTDHAGSPTRAVGDGILSHRLKRIMMRQSKKSPRNFTSAAEEEKREIWVPLMQTLKIGNLISEKSDPLIGYAGKTLTLTQTIEVEVRTISRQLIIQQIRMNLEAGPQNAFIPINDSIQFSVSEKTDSGNEDQYQLEVRASQSGLQVVDYSELRELISGKTFRMQKLGHINLNRNLHQNYRKYFRLPLFLLISIEDQQWEEFCCRSGEKYRFSDQRSTGNQPDRSRDLVASEGSGCSNRSIALKNDAETILIRQWGRMGKSVRPLGMQNLADPFDKTFAENHSLG